MTDWLVSIEALHIMITVLNEKLHTRQGYNFKRRGKLKIKSSKPNKLFEARTPKTATDHYRALILSGVRN